MKPFSVLIGANGVGKTSLLEILSLLTASCNSQIAALDDWLADYSLDELWHTGQFGEALRCLLRKVPSESSNVARTTARSMEDQA